MTVKNSVSQVKTFSVVVATTDRPILLNFCLKSLSNQKYDANKIELIIVKTSRKPLLEKSQDLISLFKKSTVIEKVGASCGEARNIGGLKAEYEYVVFLDDDAQVSPNWLRCANNIIHKHRPEVLGGPIYPFYLSKKPKWFKDSYEIRSFGNQEKWLEKGEYLSGSNLFIKTDILKKVGGTRVDLGMNSKSISLGEDTELQSRINENFPGRYYHPDLKVEHYVPSEKMKLIYKVLRLFALGRSDQVVDPQSKFKILVKFLFEAANQILLLVIYLLKFPKKRVRLKGYLWENTTKPFYWIGRLSK